MELQLASRKISTDMDAFVMGIVNCTPDSFYEKSRGGLELALKLIEDGADILNDVSALEDDERLVSLAAQTSIPVILMHKRGIPSEMQKSTDYDDIFREVDSYLSSRADYAARNGISESKIIVDPGIGFGKSLEGNALLIKKCGQLCGGKYPVLMALSRKTCIGQMTGRDASDRLFGTVAANLISVQNGASLVRVHDVASCRDSLAVLKSLR